MLSIYLGPMYAGKTSKLMEMFKSNDDIKKIIMDYDVSPKCYEGFLKNHIDEVLPSIKCNNLYDTLSIYKRRDNLALTHDLVSVYDTTITPSLHPELYKIHDHIQFSNSIYINEAQFFPDLYPFVLDMVSQQKHVYLYGLDGDFEQKKMGSLLDLVPYCDTVCKLHSVCRTCNEPAIFSKRITDSKEQYLPDENAYKPLCRNCFHIV